MTQTRSSEEGKTMTEHIRWVQTKYGGWTGHVGTMEPWAFQIWQVDGPDSPWRLDSALLGQFGYHVEHPDPEVLKPHAGRWLEQFVSSLGAIFESEPDESAAFQVREARSVLARWDAGRNDPDGKIYDRERVLADQVRALLVIAETR